MARETETETVRPILLLGTVWLGMLPGAGLESAVVRAQSDMNVGRVSCQ